jgi:hypothetical protein
MNDANDGKFIIEYSGGIGYRISDIGYRISDIGYRISNILSGIGYYFFWVLSQAVFKHVELKDKFPHSTLLIATILFHLLEPENIYLYQIRKRKEIQDCEWTE